jgi:Flp pilus assembly protein TadG
VGFKKVSAYVPEKDRGFRPRAPRRAGNALVEASFVSVIFFGLIWLAWNLCWVLFAASRMQMAVNLAARAAVTGQLQLGGADLKNTIALVAENAAPEFLSPHLACQTLNINFFDQNGNASAAPVNLGVVTVSVQNYPYQLIAPIFAIGQGSSNTQVSAVGSTGAQIWVSASRVSQACDPLNCPAVGTWPPGTCP